MKKKIYVVKTGRKTGIYDEYKKCEAQVKGFPGARFRGFDYWTEFEEDDENKEGSLRHAFMRAEEFMSDVSIGGLKLVYQGDSRDYMEEESWKKEGFLPFAEEIPDHAEDLQGGDEIDDIDDDGDADGNRGENDGTLETVDGSVKWLVSLERNTSFLL